MKESTRKIYVRRCDCCISNNLTCYIRCVHLTKAANIQNLLQKKLCTRSKQDTFNYLLYFGICTHVKKMSKRVCDWWASIHHDMMMIWVVTLLVRVSTTPSPAKPCCRSRTGQTGSNQPCWQRQSPYLDHTVYHVWCMYIHMLQYMRMGRWHKVLITRACHIPLLHGFLPSRLAFSHLAGHPNYL